MDQVKIFWRILLLAGLLSGQAQAGKYAADFLRIGVGARALGLGGAFVALADDGSACYWNPAGLGTIARHQVLFSHVQLFENLANHNFANVSVRLAHNLGLGVSWIRLATDDIPRYSSLPGSHYDRILEPALRSTGKPEGFFGDTEDALLLSIGKSFDLDLVLGGGIMPMIIPLQFSIGASYKYISQKLDTALGQGQGLDLGMMVKFGGTSAGEELPRRVVTVGFNFQDVAGTTIVWNTSNHSRDQLGVNLLYGLSYSEFLPWLSGRLTLSVGQENGYEASNNMGCEFTLKNIITLRTGLDKDNFTAGAGIKVFWLRLDYAFVSYVLGNSHRISGAIEF